MKLFKAKADSLAKFGKSCFLVEYNNAINTLVIGGASQYFIFLPFLRDE